MLLPVVLEIVVCADFTTFLASLFFLNSSFPCEACDRHFVRVRLRLRSHFWHIWAPLWGLSSMFLSFVSPEIVYLQFVTCRLEFVF